eukprot:gene1469-biopygen10930
MRDQTVHNTIVGIFKEDVYTCVRHIILHKCLMHVGTEGVEEAGEQLHDPKAARSERDDRHTSGDYNLLVQRTIFQGLKKSDLRNHRTLLGASL